MTKLTAKVCLQGKLHTKWPAYALDRDWAITVPANGTRPFYDAPYLTVTHQPTGRRAMDVRKDANFPEILSRFNEVFGKAKTVDGCVRKFKMLSNRQKRALKKGSWGEAW